MYFSKTLLLIIVSIGIFSSNGKTENRDTLSVSPLLRALDDALVATDALGRSLPEYEDAGPEKTDCYVGLFYWLWHGPLRNDSTDFDLSKILKEDPDRTQWPFLAYYWGEPELGYYRSTDEYVLQKHLNLFCLLGIDFLYLDFTNLELNKPELKLLLKLLNEMRQNGYTPPRLVPFFNTNPIPRIEEFYREFYTYPAYIDNWFILDGKPLILSPVKHPTSEKINQTFTWRKMWSGKDAHGVWHYFDDYPQTPAFRQDGRPEQIAVSASKGAPLWDYHIYGGKSSTSTYVPTYNRYWTTDSTGYGAFFNEQWQEAYRIRPLIVCITGWNEWKAEAWPATPNLVDARITFQGRLLQENEAYFVDEFNAEFNRDLEPESGEYSDNYFYQLAAHIRNYKGMKPLPEASPAQKIKIDGRFAEWTAVRPEFIDFIGDIKHRDSPGTPPNTRYINNSGRNDIVASKVTYDNQYIYFYVKTDRAISSWRDPNWMLLFIDSDKNKDTGWEGYDFMVNQEVLSPTRTTLKKRMNGNWKTVATCPYTCNGNEMELAIPRKQFDSIEKPDFYFHWVDNIQKQDDIREFFLNGDSAPERRYNYHYKAK